MSEIVDQFRAHLEPPKSRASWIREVVYSSLAFVLTFFVITLVFEQLGFGDLGLSSSLYRVYRTTNAFLTPNEYEQEARRRAAAAAQAEEDAKLDGKWFASAAEETSREPLTPTEMIFPVIFVIALGYVGFSLFFREASHKVDIGKGAHRHGGGMSLADKAAKSAKPDAISSGTVHGNRKGSAVEQPAGGEDKLTALLRRRRDDRNRPAT